jgi:hypothetical protein
MTIPAPARIRQKPIVPSERHECARFVQWLRNNKLPFTHIANETDSVKLGIRNRLMGVSKGVPDYMILVNKGVIFVEMKRRIGGKTSPHQKEWVSQLTLRGIPVKVCRGFDEAVSFVKEHL